MSAMEESSAQAGRIKVVHLSSAHHADDARIFWKECVSLARAGYDVSYIVPDAGRGPAGDIRLEDVDIVQVKRRNGRLARMVATTAEVIVTGLKRKGLIYHFHDPELIPAALLLRLLGKRVIYDVHEDLPRDIMTKDWIPRSLRQAVSLAAAAMEWGASHALSGIVAATPVIAKRFPAHRTALVQNFAVFSEAAAGPRECERVGVAFVGSVTVARCAVEVVEAIAGVKRFPNALLLMAGEPAPPSLMDDLRAMQGWMRVDYRGHLDRTGIYRLLSEARVGLALYHPHTSFAESQPVKLFEYMAAGLPVIATDFPGFRSIVEDNGCGICVPPHDVGAIVSAIEWVFDHPEEAGQMGRRGRELVARTLNWAVEEAKLLRLYERIAAAG